MNLKTLLFVLSSGSAAGLLAACSNNDHPNDRFRPCRYLKRLQKLWIPAQVLALAQKSSETAKPPSRSMAALSP